MQIDIQSMLDGFEAPAIFYRENTVRYFNQSAQTLFPSLRGGGPMPEGFDAGDSPFRAEANLTPRGTLYLFRPRLEERSAGDMAEIIRQLRSCVGVLLAAGERLSPLLRERNDEGINQMLEAANRNLYLLRRLADHTDLLRELEERRVTVYRESTLDLAGLCAEVGRSATELARRAGVRFQLDCREKTLLTVGDPALLQRMLLNLISNAMKASGPDGDMGLKLEKKEQRALLTIWDNGSGLEAERLAAVFQPQRRRGVPKPEDGVGMGLRLVREIAVLHGGVILTEAGPEGGARMTVSLPIRPVRDRTLCATPAWGEDGFQMALVELADALPASVYDWKELEG